MVAADCGSLGWRASQKTSFFPVAGAGIWLAGGDWEPKVVQHLKLLKYNIFFFFIFLQWKNSGQINLSIFPFPLLFE